MSVSRQARENVAGYLFIMPNLLGVGLFTLFPILFSLVLVFADWDYLKGFSGISWAGLDNFAELGQDEKFGKALFNTIYFTVVAVPLSMVLGAAAAIVLNSHVYLKSLIRVLFFLPYVSSVVAVGIVWSVLYNPREGPVNQFLRSLGITDPPGWLASARWAMPAIIIMMVWTYIGYAMIIYMAGLQGISKDLYEAADIDGAGKLKQLFRITVPMLKPMSFLIAITLIIASFQIFGAIAVMTQGGPLNSTMVLAYHIYLQAFRFNHMGYAATVSWVLFVLIFVVTLVQWRSQRRWQERF